MTQNKSRQPSSPYFKANIFAAPSPPLTPNTTSTSTTNRKTPPSRPRDIHRHHNNSSEMAGFASLNTDALIAAAVTPSTLQPKRLPKAYTPYTHEMEKGESSRKRGRHSQRNEDNEMEDSDSSMGPRRSRKKQKKKYGRVVYTAISDDDNDNEEGPLVVRNKGKGKAVNSFIASDSDEDIRRYTKSSKTKNGSSGKSKSKSAHQRNLSQLKAKKARGTPVPFSLETAHEADRQMFKMKAEGKSWKDIKSVWERLMGKTTGDSTLSVRYCKMKENLEISGSKEDMRLLRLKKEVETDLEADKWERVAQKTTEDGGQVLTAAEARRKYSQIQRSGFTYDEKREMTDDDDFDLGVTTAVIGEMDPLDRELIGVGDGDGDGDSDGSSVWGESDDSEEDDMQDEQVLGVADGDSGGLTQKQIELLSTDVGKEREVEDAEKMDEDGSDDGGLFVKTQLSSAVRPGRTLIGRKSKKAE